MVTDAISATQSVKNPGGGKRFFIPQGGVELSMLSAAAVLALELPPSIIVEGGGDAAPIGYLPCDGSAVSRTTYSNLFALIGVKWGIGDGSTTFNVPDLRGLFTRMIDGSAGRDPDKTLRTAVDGITVIGAVIGSYQKDAFKLHNHTVFTQNVGAGAPNVITANETNGNGSTNDPTSSVGGNETRPVNAYVNKFIRY